MKRIICFLTVATILLSISVFSGCSCIHMPNSSPENTAEPTASLDQDDYETAYEYYSNNAEIIKEEKVQESKDVLSEADAISILHERGFTTYPITYAYDALGNYCGDTEADEVSANKHPMYNTFYVSSIGEVWTVYLIGNAIFAYPASFNLETESAKQVIVSESTEIVSYDDASNTFFVTIPSERATIVKVIERIDAETLDGLTREELGKI